MKGQKRNELSDQRNSLSTSWSCEELELKFLDPLKDGRTPDIIVQPATILKSLGIDPGELESVRKEEIAVLPFLFEGARGSNPRPVIRG